MIMLNNSIKYQTMKKLLFVLVCIFALSAVDVYAQRKTSSYDQRVGGANGTVTYSYIIRDGEKVLDGPVTVKATDDSWLRTSYGRFDTKRDYSLKANNSNGMLHGAVTMKDYYSGQWSGEPASVTTRSFTANYVNGMPHGRFLLDVKEKKGGYTKQQMYVDVTYTNGVFTGSFTLQKSMGEYDDCYAKGTFNSQGQLDGKWVIEESNYQFKNGVLVGGDYMSKDANIVSISTKYANKEITMDEALSNGFLPVTKPLAFARRELYSQVANVLGWGVLVLNEYSLSNRYWNASGACINSYIMLEEIPNISVQDFNAIQSRLNYSNDYIDADKCLYTINGSDKCLIMCDNNNSLCVVSLNNNENRKCYILTQDQAKRLRDGIEAANLSIDEKRAKDIMNSLESKYLKNYNREIIKDDVAYDICSLRKVDYDRGGKLYLEVGLREYTVEQTNYYFVRTYKAEYDTDLRLGDRIPNKYDTIEELEKSLEKAEDNMLAYITELNNDEYASEHKGVYNQVRAFAEYYNMLDVIEINHDNLSSTIKAYEDDCGIINGFCSFLSLYVKACKQCDELKATVVKYTITPAPELVDWVLSGNADERNKNIKAIEDVCAAQQALLDEWKVYASLKEDVSAKHVEIVNSDVPVLSLYESLYSALVSKRTTLSDGVVVYKNFIGVQKSVCDYVEKYKAVVAANVELTVSLKPAKAIAKVYKAYYSALDLNWNSEDAVAKIEEVAAKQTALKAIAERPTLLNDDKSVKKQKIVDIDAIINFLR